MSAEKRHWDDGIDLRSFSEKCMDGLLALSAAGFAVDESRILGFYPAVEGNPFQKMLYARAAEFGFAPVAINNLDELDACPTALNVVVHFHWVHNVFAKAENEAEAQAASDTFLRRAEALKARGVKLVWTIHNVISHGTRFEKVELELRQKFADLVDTIHIMNPRTAALCAPVYTLDSHKLLEVPHPSYAGVYGDYISKFQARLDLGLPAGKPVFLLFGSLMPQKGTRQFLQGIGKLQDRFSSEAIVLVAGKARMGAFYEEVLKLSSGRTDVKLIAGHVGDQDVQSLFKAADVVVCPYTKGLNSGVVMTAVSFGRPVVVPSFIMPVLWETDIAVSDFDPSEFDGCYDACLNAYNAAQDEELENRLLAWSRNNSAQQISARFLEGLKARL